VESVFLLPVVTHYFIFRQKIFVIEKVHQILDWKGSEYQVIILLLLID
jgi:hypothetical protein